MNELTGSAGSLGCKVFPTFKPFYMHKDHREYPMEQRENVQD